MNTMLPRQLLRIGSSKCHDLKNIDGSGIRPFHQQPTNLFSPVLPQLKRLNKYDSETIAQKLKPLVGDKNVSLAEIVRSQHGQDEGPDRGEIPDVVVFAESTEHVSEVNTLVLTYFLRTKIHRCLVHRFAKFVLRKIFQSYLMELERGWKLESLQAS